MTQPDRNSWNSRDGVPTLMQDAEPRGPAAAGVQIGNFQLQALLGRGGMGEVWRAWDTKAERPVVLKLAPPELQRAAEEMARVRETFRRVHALQHQHICPLYLLDEDPRLGWYLVMKFIDGQRLSTYRATYAARHGSFPVEQVVKVLRPVAEALDYAHGQKVIHRDVKPQNILVVGNGEDVQVVDFGLAAEIRTTVSRHTQVQMDTSGTRPYMAPEQWKGQIQDARTDQYALAVVAYELLAGYLPFESADFDILRACVLNDPPEAIEEQADAVNRALLVGLGKSRQERFGSCVELVQAMVGVGSAAAPAAASTPAPAKVKVKSRKPSPSLSPQPPAVDRREPAVALVPVPKPPSVITNSIGMKLALIPAGEFLMGSPETEKGRFDWEGPQHRVRITKPFYLGVYPVTQGEYERVMGNNPSHFKESKGIMGFFRRAGDLRRPVESVSWEDAKEFSRKLSELDGREYRLPTEAEWEYACRARSQTKWSFGDAQASLGEYAWYSGNSGATTHPVGEKKPNAWGLYDMHGQVWEWCAHWYGCYERGEVSDPTGAGSASFRLVRGGSWDYSAASCRSAIRDWYSPAFRSSYLGFRLAAVQSSG